MKFTLHLLLISLLSCFALTALAHSHTATLEFIENKNQWNDKVEYMVKADEAYVFLERDAFTFMLLETDSHDGHHYWPTGNGHAYKAQFVGAKSDVKIQSIDAFPTYKNYFKGDDPQKWASHVLSYKEVVYDDLYECVDMRVYSDGNLMKYDFIVEAGANHGQIQLAYEGMDRMLIKDGNLLIHTSMGITTEEKPYAYQLIEGQEVEVACNYRLEGNSLSFDVTGSLDPAYELVIDPTLVFASFTGSSADNWGFTATYDSEGNAYGGGMVFAANYPTTLGVYDDSFNGGDIDMGISKFSPNGDALLYSTFIGGSSSEVPHSMIVNSNDELIIYGTSGSANFPTDANSYDDSFNGGPSEDPFGIATMAGGCDIVIAKLSQDGATLDGSTFFGGDDTDGINNDANVLSHNYGDIFRGEVVVDLDDNIFIASCTESDDIPTSTGVAQETQQGGQDGVIAMFSPNLENLEWATYIGGSDDDATYSLKVAENGNVYGVGGTTSDDFPANGGLNNAFLGGNADGYMIRLDPDGSNITGTHMGTSSYDQTYLIEIDEDGFVYGYGQTSGDYEVSADVYSETDGKQFIHKLTPDLTSTEFSTVFGSGSNTSDISPTALLVDVCGRIYAAGWGGNTNSAGGNTNGLTTTADAIQATTDGSDFYFIVFDPDENNVEYATYYGGSFSNEHVDGGTSRFDKNGTIYQAVCAACGGSAQGFPSTPGVVGPENESANCNLAIIKLDLEQAITTAGSDVSPAAQGCAPFSVQFSNNSEGASHYDWDFGNGDVSTLETPPPTVYTEAGTYVVQLIAIDSLDCISTDTSYTEITVAEAELIIPDFTYSLPDGCGSLLVAFEDNSQVENDIEADYTHQWQLGGGVVGPDLLSLEHTYFLEGEYDVTLTVTSTDPLCATSESVTQTISLASLGDVAASFTDATDGCVPHNINIESTGLAQRVLWLVDDVEVSEGEIFNYNFSDGGDYVVSMIAIDSLTCNVADTITQAVTTFVQPTASFTPDIYEVEIDGTVNFTNTSTEDVNYNWTFGDGGTSTEVNPSNVYTATGSYEICLEVIDNSGNCSDEYCDNINVFADWALDVPNAFSPNGDGNNDEFMVKGFGITELDLKIYNRLGELVFETNDPTIAWDGTHRESNQEVEVYTYTLIATVAGGEQINQNGNITLVR